MIDCTCQIKTTKDYYNYIVYCPMHDAAPEMLKLIKEMLLVMEPTEHSIMAIAQGTTLIKKIGENEITSRNRSPQVQAFLDAFVEQAKISNDFIESSEHPYQCRCDKCRDWWKRMGPDPDDDGYGPFTKEEIEGKQ